MHWRTGELSISFLFTNKALDRILETIVPPYSHLSEVIEAVLKTRTLGAGTNAICRRRVAQVL